MTPTTSLMSKYPQHFYSTVKMSTHEDQNTYFALPNYYEIVYLLEREILMLGGCIDIDETSTRNFRKMLKLVDTLKLITVLQSKSSTHLILTTFPLIWAPHLTSLPNHSSVLI